MANFQSVSDKCFTVTVEEMSCTINTDLLKKQDCEENLEQIKDLHRRRMLLEYLIYEYASSGEYHDNHLLFDRWTWVQKQLQIAWKFPVDFKKHKPWNMYKCTCPKFDNDDKWPHGGYVESSDCIIHSKFI